MKEKAWITVIHSLTLTHSLTRSLCAITAQWCYCNRVLGIRIQHHPCPFPTSGSRRFLVLTITHSLKSDAPANHVDRVLQIGMSGSNRDLNLNGKQGYNRRRWSTHPATALARQMLETVALLDSTAHSGNSSSLWPAEKGAVRWFVWERPAELFILVCRCEVNKREGFLRGKYANLNHEN